MNHTSIEWVKNPNGTPGYTWNPITGCLNHTPEGLCLGGMFPCYAFRLANGRLKPLYLANENWDTRTPEGYDDYPNLDPFYPRFWQERIEELIKLFRGRAKCRGIFVCDMGELFGDWVPREWQNEVFFAIKANPQHRFYLLTKQPQNLIKFSPFPDNCWVGVTATGYDAFNKALDSLKGIKAKVKYISMEPLLEAIPFYMERLAYCGINWLIIGAQTKPYKPPKIEWVEEIVRVADGAGIPVFQKNNLKPLLGGNIRQE